MHTTQIKVRFGELDVYGHVNHAVYLAYLEAARVEALASVGLGLDRLRAEGFHIVVVDLQLRFHRPALLGDVLTVETTVTEQGRASSRWQQRIARDDETLLTAHVRGAITDLEGRPRPAPAAMAAALAPLCAPTTSTGPPQVARRT
jgi:YbgC/YbaW family acyl-CoA thioester hydrolase